LSGSGFNERKLEILELVEAGFSTSSDIADACGISQSCAATLMARYWSFGLLNRYTASRYNWKEYSITLKGVERIFYLRETVFEDWGDDEVNRFFRNIERCRIEWGKV
jgi:hypothetical protein